MGLPSGRGPVEKCIQDKLYNRKVWKIVRFLLIFCIFWQTKKKMPWKNPPKTSQYNQLKNYN